MVNEATLTVQDLLCPLTTLRDTFQRPQVESISIPKLRALLAWHKPLIAKPWQLHQPAVQQRRDILNKDTFTLPRTDVTFVVDDTTRQLAIRLSDALNIDEIGAFLTTKSYLTYSLDEDTQDDKILDRLMLWVAEESLAAPQIALAALRLSNDEGTLGQLAYDVKIEAIGSPTDYIEGLFRAFSGLAQRELKTREREQDPLFWATHQLALQEAFLTLLFVTLYQNSKRPANVSQALVRGCIMSSFGTLQVNREIWEEDPAAQHTALIIRDLMVIITIESLCLGQIISPPDPSEGITDTLLQSKQTIASVHDFLSENSNDLTPHYPEPPLGTAPLPLWPMPIICLVWAIIIRSLPQDMVPATEKNSVTWQDMAIRALRLPSGLFPWMETIFSGPLMENQDGKFEEGLYYRKVFKDADLLIGLMELVQLENIADKQGLYKSWELLFGGGSLDSSSLSAVDFWIADFPYEERRAILDRSQFPYQPINLLRVLASLTGSKGSEGFGTDPAVQVHHYFTNLPTITHAFEPSWVRSYDQKEASEIVESTRTLVLPGGECIPKGSRGVILHGNGKKQVMWTGQIISGWSLLLHILEATAGLRSVDEKFSSSDEYPSDSIHLSIRDLDIQMSSVEIIAAGIKFLRSTLQSSSYIKATILTHLNPDAQYSSGQVVLDLALIILSQSKMAELAMNVDVVSDAIDTVEALITTPSSNIWSALRGSGFFDSSGKHRHSVAALIQVESVKRQHYLTTSVLRLFRTLVDNIAHIPEGDVFIITSSLRFAFVDIWCNFSGWRYLDIGKKYELSELLMGIFEMVLAHPINPINDKPTTAAQVLIDLFVTSASPLTYRPLVDAVTQSNYLVPKLIVSRRQADAELVVKCLDESLSFLATLLRTAAMVESPTSALPKSLLALPVSIPSGDKIQLVDALFDLATTSIAQPSNIFNVLTTLRTYLEMTAGEACRPSLASMLRSPLKTFTDLAKLINRTDDHDIKAAGWHLFASIISTQPGCASAVTARLTGGELESPMKDAVEIVKGWEDAFQHAPHTLSAVLNYIQCAMCSAGADSVIAILRKDNDFWQSVFDLTTRIVPAPPSFSLSFNSDDFIIRIRQYSYRVQAKVNATTLLAAELSYAANNDSEDEPETKARELVLTLFRNELALQEAGLMACHSSCFPDLHQEQGRKVKECGADLKQLKTRKMVCEREFGNTYLYDGTVVISESASRQASLNLALDLLNLNWSMVDADAAFTRSFRLLAESISIWIEGDPLAKRATLQTAIALAETIAEEHREGDVMLSVQTERLSILAVLLETALDPQEEDLKPEASLVSQLAMFVYNIINDHTFPPIISLRNPGLPAIHQPVVRILYLVLQNTTANPPTLSNITAKEALMDTGTAFALESADIVLETILRGERSGFTELLSMVVSVLCEISRLSAKNSVWLDRVYGVNLIGRSRDVLVRTRIIEGQIPPHLTSILLLHFALASKPSSAEKLAVSGILSAYSDNAIAADAELGQIEAPSSAYNSVHSAWCGMLLVVKALLATLPDTASFTRTDIVPFLKVFSGQMARAMSWNGETPVTKPYLEEMELVIDVFFGVACALGPRSLDDYTLPALGLLGSIRYGLTHPRGLSALFVPSSEYEKAKLEEELAAMEEEEDVNLFDIDKRPVLAERATVLLRIGRTIILTLIVLTRAWEILREAIEPERLEEYVLVADDDTTGSTSSDPVGIVNDIYVVTRDILTKLPSSTPTLGGKYKSTPSRSVTQGIRDVATQILESSSLVSFTQLKLRHARLTPEERGYEEDSAMNVDDSMSMKRRLSFQGESKEAMAVRELAGDLAGMLAGEDGVMGALQILANDVFGVEV
nr:nuclear pore complex protein Nup188 [Cryptococcus depauperatus CBS 7855]